MDQTDRTEPPTQATVGQEPTIPAPRDSQVRLEVGSQLGGRYQVLAFVGEGGMGAVYRALDEKLGEEVALKVVRGGLADDTLRDEVRLAQKVTHRNVCRTYDLEDAGGHWFVKMEYVQGETLFQRLVRGRLPIDEAVRIARGIADGLDAAHAQGIVHRDLKPGNIMLAKDRAVLTDFGVARLIESGLEGVAGTPGYMSPEQITGTAVDGRADTYALGCLLYEMLAGQPVFGRGKPIEIATRHVSLPAPDVRAQRPEVPRWLARAIDGMLDKDRTRRPPGVARLRAGRRSPWRIALPVVAVVAAIAGVAYARSHSHRELCKGAERKLAGVWDPPTKLAIHKAFSATHRPFAEASFGGLARAVDGYAADWTSTATDACEATRVRGDQTAEVQALRQDCLDERLEELGALTQLLASADAALVEKGDQVVVGLEPITRCSNVIALREPDQPPPEKREQILALRKKQAAALADMLAGKTLSSLVESQAVIDGARSIGYESLVVQALWLHASALVSTGNSADAAKEFGDTVYAAIRSKRDDYAADAGMSDAIVTLSALGKPGEARIWLGIATAAAKRSGNERVMARKLLEIEGLIDAESGDFNAGIALQEKALALAEHELGKTSPLLFENEQSLGTTLSKAGVYARAAPHYERAIALREAGVGPDHPDIATLLNNLAACYTHMRDPRAKATFERALAIKERTFGKQSPYVIATLDNYGELMRETGDLAGALASMERGLKIAKLVPGVDHPMYHQIATDYADTLVAAGRLADARALLDEVLAIEDRNKSTILPATLTSRAELAIALHAPDAAAFAERAIAAYEAAGGATNPALWRPLTALARTKPAAQARSLLERAIAIGEAAQVTPADLAPTRELLAKLH